MSERKFTSGPWAFVQYEGRRAITLKRTHWRVGQAQPAHQGVAIVFGGHGDPTDANARLIAAAPDLYAALEGPECLCCDTEREIASAITWGGRT